MFPFSFQSGAFADNIPNVGYANGNLRTGKVLQYESTSCFVDNGSKYEE